MATNKELGRVASPILVESRRWKGVVKCFKPRNFRLISTQPTIWSRAAPGEFLEIFHAAEAAPLD
jgi:hypothetical protein